MWESIYHMPLKLILSKKSGKDQESMQSSTTPDPGYHMGKWQKRNQISQQELGPNI